jgi:hypothetical protein
MRGAPSSHPTETAALDQAAEIYREGRRFEHAGMAELVDALRENADGLTFVGQED